MSSLPALSVIENSNNVKRLNPKLTRRRYIQPPAEPPPSEQFEKNSDVDPNILKSITFRKQKQTEDDISLGDGSSTSSSKLQHTGKWILKEFDAAGKAIERTGLWDCCGWKERFSIYCQSEEDRAAFAITWKQQEEEKEKALRYSEFVLKFRREQWLKDKETENPTKETDADDSESSLGSPVKIKDETALTMATTDNNQSVITLCNAPMLVSWLYKHMDDDFTVRSGLALMMENVATGQGCKNLMQFDCVRCVLRALNTYKKHMEIQLLGISLLRRLLDCNLTRDVLIEDVAVVRVLFSVCHRFMDSQEHVEQGVSGILQCARSERCREEIMRLRVVDYTILFCGKFWKATTTLRPALKLFNWLATTPQRMETVCEAGAVRTSLKAMERHITNPDVLAPAMHFLTRAAASYPPASAYLLRKKAVPTVIGAMKSLYFLERLQLEGLKMLQALSCSEEGWQQISDTKGGWQSITQGVSQGDALFHELQGEFHNPGWAIGDTRHLPEIERKKLLAAAAEAQNSLHNLSVEWTSNSLRLYMGQSLKDQKLAINIEFHETYFELLKSLELLPINREEREDWFKRLKEYEHMNSITIEDMVQTVLDMRKREGKEKEALAKAAEEQEYVKPLFVKGKRVTTKAMDEADRGISEELDGIMEE